MPRFDLPANSTFRQFAAVIAEYIEPFEQMWPFFWLKAAAVRDGEIWHLCHFDLVGRWSDVAPIRQVRDRGDALAAVSHVIDAGQARAMLHAIAERGQLSLLPDVTAQVPDINLTETSYHWQESVGFIAEDVKDVLEPVAFISQADSVEAVRYFLWLPPWVELKDSWAYFSGHIGLVNNPYFRPV